MAYTLSLLVFMLLLAGAFGFHATLKPVPGPLMSEGNWVSLEIPELEGCWTVLSFFVSERAACHDDVPGLNALHRKFAERELGQQQLVVVGVTLESRLEARAFVKQHELAYPVLADARVQFELYGVETVPDTFLVDPDGAIVARGLSDIAAALERTFTR